MEYRISVLTPTIRPEHLAITAKSLQNQSFKDFEWLVDIDFPSDRFLLPMAMNRLLSRAKGEIIVILQDCITVEPNFLQHVSDTYTEDFVTYPLGKEGPGVYDIKWDWRKSSIRQAKDFIEPQCWESDIASAPRKAFFDIGGYDEAYCDGWSWDNVEVAYRAEIAGYKFRCDNRVSGIAIDHDAVQEHPFRGKLKNNDWRSRETKWLCEAGDYKLSYLKEKDVV